MTTLILTAALFAYTQDKCVLLDIVLPAVSPHVLSELHRSGYPVTVKTKQERMPPQWQDMLQLQRDNRGCERMYMLKVTFGTEVLYRLEATE